MKIEKPPVLTHGEVLLLTDNPHFSAEESRREQRDADVAYYEPLIQQAKEEVADKIIEEIGSRLLFDSVNKCLWRLPGEYEWWQSLKSKYRKG